MGPKMKKEPVLIYQDLVVPGVFVVFPREIPGD